MGDEKQIVPYTSVRYVAMGEIVIYLISDDELRTLERGDPSSTYLNLAIFLLSVGTTFFSSLLVSSPQSTRAFIVIVVITVASAIVGVVLAILWWKSAGRVSEVVQRIRERSSVSRGASGIVEEQDVKS
jgi:protein-S-isoprenylcysteine O-methyltransferase Ste14